MSEYICPYRECALFREKYDNHCYKYTDIRLCEGWKVEDKQEREFQENARKSK